MRQIVVDTETTGLDLANGHRVIEIGCVEIVGRRLSGATFHHYINPQGREIDEAAGEVHGITADRLKNEPIFADLAEELIEFISGAELIIHNATFDVAFLNNEFKQSGHGENVIKNICSVTDTLMLAREKYPGRSNSLDALCKRYFVDNSQRTLHGALLDAEILADVYLAMTGGQVTLLGESHEMSDHTNEQSADAPMERILTPLISATDAELTEHEKWKQLLEQSCTTGAVWRKIENTH